MIRLAPTPRVRPLSLLLLGALVTAVSLSQERTPIVLDRADALQVFEENGIRRQELRGNVRMIRDSLTVDCQTAIFYPDSGLVIFKDKVEFRDPVRTLFADQVIYNDVTQEVDASGQVRIYQSDSLAATARRAKYRERFKQAYLYDDVRMRQENRKINLTGEVGFLDHEREYGWVTGNPVLTERDSTLRLLTEIHGDTIHYSEAEKLARVGGDVTVERDSLIGHGTSLVYSTGERVATLTGKPAAERGLDDMHGDTIRLFFDEDRINRVLVSGRALVTSPADSGFSEPRHRMEGKEMTLWVTEGRLDSALIEGTAVATYFIREDGKPKGLNVTSGDRLHVYFDERKISRIHIVGGTMGDYTPQRLVSILPDTP